MSLSLFLFYSGWHSKESVYLEMMKKIVTQKFFIYLGLVLALAIILRFPFLNTFPPSMVQDEVGLGYTAISIAETGKDEWGNSFPLVFKSFGDYKPPAFFYATALLYKIVGWQEVLPRITSALAGLFVVLFGALWIRKIGKSDHLGLIGGLILAVSPWTVHLSRMALESNLGLAFFFGGLFYLSDAKKSKLKVVLSALFFSLSTYSYHGFRFTVVLFLGSVLAVTVIAHLKHIRAHFAEIITLSIVLLLSTILSLPGFFIGGATNRLDQTLTLTSEKTLYLYNHYENNCHVTFIEIHPQLTKLCKLKYNRFTKPLLIGTDSFVKHLSPAFLFFVGDSDVGRNPTEAGEFFVILFPIWMIGILLLIKNYRQQLLLVVGYFIAILPSTFAGDPHAIRMSAQIPFVVAVLVLGYDYLRKKYSNFSKIAIITLLFFTGAYALMYGVTTYATHEGTATFLSYAKKIAVLSHQYAQDGFVVYADHDLYPEPHMYYAYYNHIDPVLTQQSFANIYEESTGFTRPTQFGNRVFFEEGNSKSLTCDSEYTQPTVFITNDPQKFTPTKTIQDNTNTYDFAYVYTIEAMRSEKTKLLSFCNS